MGHYFSVPLAISIAIPLIAGSIVSASTVDNILVWYKTLKKPSWNLPTPVFGPTWSFLYVFMGLASFVVWTQGGFAEQTGPLLLYAVNLALNLAWMPIFFNQKDFQLAQIDNVATLASAVVLAKWFYRIKPVAGALLWPYVAFLTFANALNLYHLKYNSNRPLEEDLRREPGMENPGEGGYGALRGRDGGTSGARGYPSGGANACLADPCRGRGRSGRPVLVRAAATQVKAVSRPSLSKRASIVRTGLSLQKGASYARIA